MKALSPSHLPTFRPALSIGLLIVLTLGALNLPSATPARAGVITVCLSGCDYTTVQAAVDNAVNGDTISILEPVLTEAHTDGGILVTKNVTIQGQGMEETILQAAASPEAAPGRVMEIYFDTHVILRDLTIRNGRGHGGWHGGGLNNYGYLTLERVKVTSNRSENNYGALGGGINSQGTLTITNSIISDNLAIADVGDPGRGGGLYAGPGSIIFIENSTISGNTALGSDESGVKVGIAYGGGIAVFGDSLTLKDSTVSGNEARGGSAASMGGGKGMGGGIYRFQGTLVILNSTISGNTAEGGSSPVTNGAAEGGGVWANEVTITNSTVAGNTVSGISTGLKGGGLFSGAEVGLGPFIKNSIFAKNFGPSDANGPDMNGNIKSQDYNLIENANGYVLTGSTGHNRTGVDSMLGELRSNGGLTQTRALLTGSPAIDKGSCPGVTADQRGFPRPVDVAGIANAADGCDIGAYEYLPFWIYLPVVAR